MNLPSLSYEAAKNLIQNPDPGVRLRVAIDTAAPPEVLYFLAGDEDLNVRLAVAANRSTPAQADLMLARDADVGVRCALARKMVGDGLSEEKRRGLWRMGFTILEALATDQAIRVRSALADGLKSLADAPKLIVFRLACDPEPEVAAPVIGESPVLNDHEILTILDDKAEGWAYQAAAGRSEIGPMLADRIAVAGSEEAVGELIGNKGASILDSTLSSIVARASAVPGWHEPLVRRAAMPGRLLVRLARFVAAPLLAILRSRPGLDEATREALEEVGSEHDTSSEPPPEEARDPNPEDSATPWEGGPKAAIRLHYKGGLNDEVVASALDSGGDEFVVAALAVRAELALEVARVIVASRSPRAITALCWKGGFRMRFAMEIQRRLVRVSPPRVLNARNGVDYPMSRAEMEKELRYFLE